MSIFASLTDEELQAEIDSLAARIRGAPAAPAVKSVTGEGRRIEYENMRPGDLRRLYNEALEEQQRRTGEGLGGRAIGVRF